MDLFPRLYPSQLEPRIVLNAAPMAQLDPSGVLLVDAGDFANDGNTDTFEVHLSEEAGGTLNVSVNDVVVYTGAVDAVRGIQISGSADTDLLTLDAAVLDRVSVSFDSGEVTDDPGGAAENRDSVQLIAGQENAWQAVTVDLSSVGGEIQLTRNDGVLSAGLSFTGTIDVIDSLAVADRTLAIGDLTSVIILGQDGVLEVRSEVGTATLQFTHGDQAAWNIDATGGALRFEGAIDVLSLNARADHITVAGSVTASAGAMLFEANNHFQLDETAGLITSANSITIHAEDITLAGAIVARDGGAVFATAGEDGTLRVSGLIDASDNRVHGTGGQVHLDGGEVVLTGAAEVNASGANGGGEITITADQIELAGAISTNGSGAILLQGNVLLIGDSLLSVKDGNLKVAGAIDGSYALTLAANTGEIVLQGPIGNAAALESLMVQSAGTVSFAGTVITSGDQQITSETVHIAARHQTTNDNAKLTIAGAIVLQADTILKTAGGDLKIEGSLNSSGDGGATSDHHNLTVDAGDGNAMFLATIGGAADGALGNLHVTAHTIQLADIGSATTAGIGGQTDLIAEGGIILTGSIIHSVGGLHFAGPLTIAASDDLLIMTTGGGENDRIVFTSDVSAAGWAADFTVHTEGVSEIKFAGAIELDGNVLLHAGGDLTVVGAVSTAGSLTVRAADVCFESLVSNLQDLTVTALGTVDFLQALTASGSVLVETSGKITFHDQVALGGGFDVSGDVVRLTHDLTTGGAIRISALNALSLGADVDAGSETISLRANQDGMGSQGLVLNGLVKTLNTTANALTIDVGGAGNVLVAAIDVGGGVVIDAGGAVRGLNNPAADIQAATLQIITGRGIDVQTTAAEVTAEVTQAGDIRLGASGLVTADRLVTHAGSIDFVSGDTMQVGEVTAGSGGNVTLTAQQGSVLALPGSPGTSLVRADLLTLAAPSDITLWTDANALHATLSGTGSLTIHNQGALTLASASVHDGDATLTAASFVISAAALGSATPDGLAGLDDANGHTFHAPEVSTVTATNLTLQAVDGSIVIDANTLADGVDLIVEAATAILVNGPLQASGGDITLTAAQLELNGAISTSGSGAILLHGAVLLNDDSSLGVEDGDLNVVGTVDGSYALTLTSHTGEIVLQGHVGGAEALVSLVVQSAGTVSFAAFAAQVITTGDQQITAETVLAAALHQTDDATITITGELVLHAHTVLNTNGGELTLSSIAGEGYDLQLISGAGTTTVTGPVTGIGQLTLQQDSPAATGAVSLEGNLAAERLTTFAQSYSVSLIGNSTTITQAVTFKNTGGVILGNGASELNFSGGLTNTVSTTTLNGTLLTNSQHISLSDLVVAGDSTIHTGGGDLQITGSLNSSGDGVASHQHDLSINAGDGNALLATVGGAADGALGNLQVTAQTIQLANIGTAAAAGAGGQTEFTAQDGITLTGSIIHTTGGLRFAGPLTIDTSGNLLIMTTGGGANDRIVFSGDVGHAADWNADFTARTQGVSAIEFDAAIDIAGNLLVDAAGNLSVGGIISTGGTLTLQGANVSLLTDVQSAGAVSVTAANTLTLGGGLDATDQTIVLRANQNPLENGGFVQADSAIIQTTHHASDAIQIIVGGSGDATLATLVASSGGVHISAVGKILGGVAALGPDGKAINITANDLVLESGMDIVLTTNVQTLSATVTDTGNLQIDQSTRLLTVANLNLAAGNATLSSDAAVVLQTLNLPAHSLTLSATDVRFELPICNLRDLTVTALGSVNFLQALTASGSVLVQTSGDITFHDQVALGGGFDVSGDVVTLTHDLTTGGEIRISALNELSLNGNVDAGSATIVLLVNQDNDGNTGFTQVAGTIIRSSSDAADAIAVSVGGNGDASLIRIEASAGGVVINAGGQISDSGTSGASVQAKTLTATAATGIDLKTDIDAFSGNITESGMLRLVEANALEIVSVMLADGNASISADTLTVGAITATGSVALTARTGAITDGNGDLLNITAESLSLSSVNGIDLDTRVGTIDLTASGPGDVHLEQSTRSLVVTNLDVAGGDVVLVSDAALSLQDLSILLHSLSVSATDITFENTLQSLSDLTVAATGDVVFLAAIDLAGLVEVDAAGDVTFYNTVALGGEFDVSGDVVTLTQSLTTSGVIRISAMNALSLGADVDAGSETISLRANQDGMNSQGLVLHGLVKTLNTTADALVIDVGGGGNVRVDAIDVGGGVVIHAGGDVRGLNNPAADIQAATLQLLTGRGIDVQTTAAEVTAEVTQAGDIRLGASGVVTADRLMTANGSIDFVSGDTMQVGEVTAGSGGNVTLTAQQGSILALPGSPGTSLVRADLLTLAASADIILWTDASILNAAISDTGSLTIHNQGALSVAGASVHDGDATLTAASLVIGSITAPGSVALTANSGGILGNDETTHLIANELILESAGEIDLRTNIDFLSATISQQGNLQITDIGQLRVNLINLSNGRIDIEASEELVIMGGVATEQGAIRLVSVNGDLKFINPVTDSILLVYSGGDDARIEGVAGFEVIITGPGLVLFRTPQSQYFTVRPELHADALHIPTLGNVQVDHEGWATLIISFGNPIGVEELYFRLVIDWGDSVQTITAANSEGSLIPLQRAGEAGSPLLYKIQHQYLKNPNLQDPTAPIPISIVASNSLINGGPADIAFFADGNPADPLVTQVDLVLNVPGTGLSITAVPVIPTATQERTAEPEQPMVDPPASTVIPDSSRSAQPLVMATETPAVYERYYVLRIVVQVDEEGNTRELADIRIDDDYLRNLPKLFEMLPDDRYRLYQIREDGVAQLVTDVIIRGGRSAGTLDLDEGLEQLDEHGSNLESAPGPSPEGIPANALDGLQVVPDLQSSWREASPTDFLMLTKTGIWVGPTIPNPVISGGDTATAPRELAPRDLAPLPLAVQVQRARR